MNRPIKPFLKPTQSASKKLSKLAENRCSFKDHIFLPLGFKLSLSDSLAWNNRLGVKTGSAFAWYLLDLARIDLVKFDLRVSEM
ncbi:hypothetical protein K1719_031542 [Acacia pycnantha]|nr:hypothetical protein K1719_031542 [Acacia pycnantha]